MGRSVVIIGTRGYPSYYGGFETAVRKLAPWLTENGWKVTVYGRPGMTRENDPDLDPRVVTVNTRGFETKSLSTLSYGLTACLHAARTKPDVALVMNVANGFWLPLLKARGIPTVVNVDGIEWDRAKWGTVAKKIFHYAAKLTAKFATTLVFDAMEIERRWRTEFARDGHFIPYGGDVPECLPLVSDLSHRGYVLLVARFVPENTVDQFLEAAASLSEHWPVVLVGSSGYGGRLDEKAKELARERKRVRWLGHVSDDKELSSLWQHAGAYFHGHSVGGTNPALVQAMACGAPIVARDTVYNREVLGATGRFVNPDPKAIAEGIAEVMKNPELQNALSQAASARATAEYGWDQVCRRYEDAQLGVVKP